MSELFSVNLYLLGGISILIFLLVFFAIFLHNSRKASTKATDYFNHLHDDTEKTDDIEESINIIEEKEDKENEDKSNNTINITHKETYLLLIENLKNQKDERQLHQAIKNIDEDAYTDPNRYASLSELSSFIAIDTEIFISRLIYEGLLERDGYTLLLTEEGFESGGRYQNENELVNIEFPINILFELDKGDQGEKPPPQKLYKKNKYDELNFWVLLIVLFLIYAFFFN